MIYDCFLYYDEDMLLDIRLHTLANVVDKFVIVESKFTFTGRPKPLNFNIEKFKAFADKIIYVVNDTEPTKLPEQNTALIMKLTHGKWKRTIVIVLCKVW